MLFTDETCDHAASRRRRDVVDDLASQYAPGSAHHTFCINGTSEHHSDVTQCWQDAQRLATEHRLSSDDERIQAFHNCCIHIVNYEMDNNREIHEEEEVRSDFPETWIFEEVELE